MAIKCVDYGQIKFYFHHYYFSCSLLGIYSIWIRIRSSFLKIIKAAMSRKTYFFANCGKSTLLDSQALKLYKTTNSVYPFKRQSSFRNTNVWKYNILIGFMGLWNIRSVENCTSKMDSIKICSLPRNIRKVKIFK